MSTAAHKPVSATGSTPPANGTSGKAPPMTMEEQAVALERDLFARSLRQNMTPDAMAAARARAHTAAMNVLKRARAEGRPIMVVYQEEVRNRTAQNAHRPPAAKVVSVAAKATTAVARPPSQVRAVAPRAKGFTFSELAKGASTSQALWLDANQAWEQGREGKHVRRVEEERTHLRELFTTLADMEYRGAVPGSLPLSDRLLLAVDPTIPLPETKPRKPLTDGDMQAILFQLDLPESVRGVNRAILYDTLKHALETQNPIMPQVAVVVPTDVQPFGLDGALLPSDPTIPWGEANPDEQARRFRRYRHLERAHLRSPRGLKLYHRKATLTLPRGFHGHLLYPDVRTLGYEIEKRGGSVSATLDLGGRFGRPHWHIEAYTDLTHKELKHLWAEICGASVNQQRVAFIQVRNPEQADHRFRSKPITNSGASRSLIPVEADHRFRSGRSVTG